MTGLNRTTDGLDSRRKRMLFRAWHRGTREMDLLMGRYCESVIEVLSEDELTILETLSEEADRDLLAWLTGAEPVPPAFDNSIFQAMKAFHRHDKPIDF